MVHTLNVRDKAGHSVRCAGTGDRIVRLHQPLPGSTELGLESSQITGDFGIDIVCKRLSARTVALHTDTRICGKRVVGARLVIGQDIRRLRRIHVAGHADVLNRSVVSGRGTVPVKYRFCPMTRSACTP